MRKLLTAMLAVAIVGSLATVATGDTLTPSAGSLSVPVGETRTVTFTLLADKIAPFTHSGCDLQGGAMAVMVDFASVYPAIATVSPSQHLFADCGESVVVTVTGVAEGNTSITAVPDYTDPATKLADPTHDGANPGFGIQSAAVPTTVGGGGGGGENETGPSVSFTLTPSVADGDGGWYRQPVAVDWTVTGTPTPSTLGCTDTTYSVDGEYALTCSATNTAGSDSATAVFKIDQTAPTNIQFVGAPAAGGTVELGTLTSAPTCTADDATSLLASCIVTGYGTGLGPHTLTATATDNAGNVNNVTTLSYTVVDTTAPAVNVALQLPDPDGSNGWYVTPVAVSLSATDADTIVRRELEIDGNGLAAYTAPITVSTDGPHTAYGEAEDASGNIGFDTETFMIDATDPTDITFVGAPAHGATVEFDPSRVAPTCTATDATSGMDSCVVSGFSNIVGTHTLTATATDQAGNSDTATSTYTVADTTPPVVNIILTPGSPNGDNGWYTSPVDVSMTATDLADIVSRELKIDADDWNPYTSAVTVSADGLHAANARATDAHGLTGTAQRGFKIDQTPPQVTITGGGGQFTGTWPTCGTTDATSGVALSATRTLIAPDGGVFGTWTITCTDAKDNAGNLQDDSEPVFATVELTHYPRDGGIREPIDPRRDAKPQTWKRGQTVPVKFRLLGDEAIGGFPTADFIATAIPVLCTPKDKIAATLSPFDLTNKALGGFRYDASGDQYILNADFRSAPLDSCWFVRVTLGDSVDPQNLLDSAIFKLVK